jgi:hypothetical protein
MATWDNFEEFAPDISDERLLEMVCQAHNASHAEVGNALVKQAMEEKERQTK